MAGDKRVLSYLLPFAFRNTVVTLSIRYEAGVDLFEFTDGLTMTRAQHVTNLIYRLFLSSAQCCG